MKNYFLKLKEVLIPFLVINILTSILFIIIYWLLIIKGEINIKDKIVNFFIPIALPWIPLYIWLRPAIKKLQIKNDRIPFLYLLVSWILIFFFSIFSVQFIKKAIGTVTKVKNVSEIYQSEKTIYYNIADYDLSNNLVEKSFSTYRSGKHNQHVNLDIFFTVPIVNENDKLTEPKYYKLWMCQKFSTQESSHKNESEINRAFRFFEKNTISEYLNQDKPIYFERLPYSEQKIQALKAIEKTQPGFNHDDVLILSPLKHNPKDDIKRHLKNMVVSFFSGIVFFLLVLIAPKLKKSRNKAKSRRKDTDLSEALSLIIPKKGIKVITPILLWINIIVFIVTVLWADVDIMYPTGGQLLNSGGLLYDKVAGGEIWRIISSIFIHAGIAHLLYNGINLVIAGIFVELTFGRTKYILIYLLSGIIAAITAMLWNPESISVGASGAIFGLFGAIFVQEYQIRGNKAFSSFISIYIGISLLSGFVIPGISNTAHIAGLISGAIISYIIKKLNF